MCEEVMSHTTCIHMYTHTLKRALARVRVNQRFWKRHDPFSRAFSILGTCRCWGTRSVHAARRQCYDWFEGSRCLHVPVLWVMSHICMSHVTNGIRHDTNESSHKYEWVMSQTYECVRLQMWMSKHVNTYGWVMSRIWMSHVTYVKKALFVYVSVLGHIWIHMHESYHIYERYIHTSDMLHSHVWHGLIHMCDRTGTYVRHDLFICATWVIYVLARTHSHVRHDSSICVTWLMYLWYICGSSREVAD